MLGKLHVVFVGVGILLCGIQSGGIAGMMRDLKYINSDVSAAVEKNMDYRFLEAATGKPKSELGY